MVKNEYSTAQKRTLLDFLKSNSDRDFTIDEIILAMTLESAEGLVSPAKSSVYRQIKKLCENGLVRRFESKDKNSFVYQFIESTEECDRHFHLKCVRCGKLYHVECSFLDSAKEHIRQKHGFVIGENQSILYGVCEKCIQTER